MALRDQEAAGSNPVTPMRKTAKSLRFGGLLIFAFWGLTTWSTIDRRDFGIRFFWFVLLWILPQNGLFKPNLPPGLPHTGGNRRINEKTREIYRKLLIFLLKYGIIRIYFGIKLRKQGA